MVAGGRLRPPAELRAEFTAAGVDPAQPLVCSCGSGVTASILALALHQLAPATLVRPCRACRAYWALSVRICVRLWLSQRSGCGSSCAGAHADRAVSSW